MKTTQLDFPGSRLRKSYVYSKNKDRIILLLADMRS